MDVLAWLLGGIGGAVVGAIAADLLARRRDSRERARVELVKLQGAVTTVHEQVAVLQAVVLGVSNRVSDAVRTLDTDERNHS